MEINIQPIAFVKNSRVTAIDDNWANIVSEIKLITGIPSFAFDNIELFSHLDIIYYFDKAIPNKYDYRRKPRGNEAYPAMGIFAQRNKDRPNNIGLTRVQLLKHDDNIITVKYLDAIDGTPVLDIKPVFKQFQQATEIIQPQWVDDLTKEYW